MRRYLLDSGIASDCINRRRGVDVRAQEEAARGGRIGVCVPVMCELFGGVELSRSRQKNRARLHQALKSMFVWPFDRAAAEEYGRLYAALRRAGRVMQQIDLQIAAVAITLGRCTVVTRDSDLTSIPGLSVEDWSTS